MALPKGTLKRTHRLRYKQVTGGPRSKHNACQVVMVKHALEMTWADAFMQMSALGWNAKTAPNVYIKVLSSFGWERFSVPTSQGWQFQNCAAPLAVLGGSDGYTSHVAFVKGGRLVDTWHSGACIIDEVWLPREEC